MDFQYGAAVIVILLGLGLTQMGGEDNSFFVGAGFGTLVVGCIWVFIRLRKEYKKRWSLVSINFHEKLYASFLIK